MDEQKRMEEVSQEVENVQLQEMDWQQAKKQAKNLIREGMLQVEMGRVTLAKAELKLREIWDKLPAEKREKRLADKD